MSELVVEDGLGSDELRFAPRSDLLRDDCVAIMVVEYNKVLAATTVVDGEASSLVLINRRWCYNY